MLERAANLIVTRSVCVRVLGVSDRTFSRLESEGVLHALEPRRKPFKYDLAAVVQAYIANQEVKLTGSMENPRDQRERAVARLTNLRAAKEEGKLLPLADVVAVGRGVVAAVTAKVRGLPARLVRAGLVAPEGRERAVELVREALEEIVRLESLDAMVAAGRERAS